MRYVRNDAAGRIIISVDSPSGKHQRAALSEFQIRPALVPPQRAESNGALDVDAAILHRLDGVGDLDQLARGLPRTYMRIRSRT
jgi:hypothetical protein